MSDVSWRVVKRLVFLGLGHRSPTTAELDDPPTSFPSCVACKCSPNLTLADEGGNQLGTKGQKGVQASLQTKATLLSHYKAFSTEYNPGTTGAIGRDNYAHTRNSINCPETCRAGVSPCLICCISAGSLHPCPEPKGTPRFRQAHLQGLALHHSQTGRGARPPTWGFGVHVMQKEPFLQER